MFSNRFTATTLAATTSLLLASPAFAARDVCYDIETVNVQDEEGRDRVTQWTRHDGLRFPKYLGFVQAALGSVDRPGRACFSCMWTW